MRERRIFEATQRLQDEIDRLSDTVRSVLPPLEDALRSTADGRARAPYPSLKRIAEPMQQAVLALADLHQALSEELLPPGSVDNDLESRNRDRLGNGESSSVEQGARGSTPAKAEKPKINFDRFKKLSEPLVVEKAIEIVASLRGDEWGAELRLEARRSVSDPGYEVAVYRKRTVLLSSPPETAGEPVPESRRLRVWVAYDQIRSDQPTAEQALEQVLGFLELRCE
jgi:hypothetical protein